MATLEVFKITLLVFTLLILIYVLYKRLIHILRKDVVRADYPSIGNALVWTGSRSAVLEISLKRKTNLRVEIFSEKGQMLHLISSESYDIGVHNLQLNFDSLQPGRYYYQVSSDKQQASQYFVIS